jgi:hypothetical protein
LDLFVLGADNRPWRRAWNGSQWQAWSRFEHVLGPFEALAGPGVVSSEPDRIDTLWPVANTGDLRWVREILGQISSGIGHGGTLHQPALASRSAGQRDGFVTGFNNEMYHSPTIPPKAANNWGSLGGQFISGPAAFSWGLNHLDVYGIGADDGIWHKWWNGTHWDGWHRLPAATPFPW